jgi:hypothetical protein
MRENTTFFSSFSLFSTMLSWKKTTLLVFEENCVAMKPRDRDAVYCARTAMY